MSGKSKSLTTYPAWQVSSENYVGACQDNQALRVVAIGKIGLMSADDEILVHYISLSASHFWVPPDFRQHHRHPLHSMSVLKCISNCLHSIVAVTMATVCDTPLTAYQWIYFCSHGLAERIP